MDVNALIHRLENCPCGRAHTAPLRVVEVSHGAKARTAEILSKNNFPRNLLVVADKNTLRAADGILEILEKGGFAFRLHLYDNFREPLIEEANAIAKMAKEVEGILSIGTGSLNDVCRKAALDADRAFAIFATAPSMDGFASGTAPIIENGAKSTLPARQPSIVIADTEILAASPAVLKAAGFGDVIGKYIALADWRISTLLVGEYYCEQIANLVRDALERMVAMADRVTGNDEETAGFIMETLILTGIAMALAESSRPASGAEHQISHLWGMKQLDAGVLSDFHGKKVGVATAKLARVYHRVAELDAPNFVPDRTDMDAVYAAYGERFRDFITEMNRSPITERVTPEMLRDAWPQIQRIIKEEIPPVDELLAVMHRAGAATEYHEIGVDDTLAEIGLRYHSYMRSKVVLTRLLPMTDQDVMNLLQA